MMGGAAFPLAVILLPVILWVVPRLLIVLERLTRTPETAQDKARTAEELHKRLHGFLG